MSDATGLNFGRYLMDPSNPLAGVTLSNIAVPSVTGGWDSSQAHWSGGISKVSDDVFELVYTSVLGGSEQAMGYAFTDAAGEASGNWYISEAAPLMRGTSPWLGDWGDPLALEIGDFRFVRAYELNPPELQLWMSRGTGATGRAGMIYLTD